MTNLNLREGFDAVTIGGRPWQWAMAPQPIPPLPSLTMDGDTISYTVHDALQTYSL